MRAREHHADRGTTLIEMALATAIMLVVIGSVGTGVMILSGDTATMGRSTIAIDNLQVAEQAIVKDIHAATSWCQAPTVSQLEFLANVKGSAKAFEINITSGNLLTLATATSCAALASVTARTLLTNVDTSSSTSVTLRSGFSQPNGPSTVTEDGDTYYDSMAVTLTIDSPSVSASRITRTTVSDPVVEIWNAEELCQNDWLINGSGTDPC